ncbi:hypothetical protein D3C80_1316240 [compost metagenome]
MAFGEDFVDVLFHCPGCAHPPAWHLVNDHIGPEELADFIANVVTLVDVGHFDIDTATVQHAQGGFVQGGVVAAVGVGEFLAAVEQ